MSWDEVHRGRAWGSWPSEEVVRTVLRADRPLDVLDVGCGGGANLRLLEQQGHRATALDISLVALQRLHGRPDLAGPLAVQATAARLPFGECFDLVLDVEALCYLAEAELGRAWAELARVLRPGGTVLSIAFTDGSYASRPGGGVQAVTAGPLAGVGPTMFLDERALTGLVTSVGLRIEDLQVRSRTVGPDRDLIEEWVLSAIKEAT